MAILDNCDSIQSLAVAETEGGASERATRRRLNGGVDIDAHPPTHALPPLLPKFILRSFNLLK